MFILQSTHNKEVANLNETIAKYKSTLQIIDDTLAGFPYDAKIPTRSGQIIDALNTAYENGKRDGVELAVRYKRENETPAKDSETSLTTRLDFINQQIKLTEETVAVRMVDHSRKRETLAQLQNQRAKLMEEISKQGIETAQAQEMIG